MSLALSLPARSTKWSLERRNLMSSGSRLAMLSLALCSSVIDTMAWERLDSEFILHDKVMKVSAVLRLQQCFLDHRHEINTETHLCDAVERLEFP